METLEVVEVLPDSGDESDASSTGDMSRSFWTTQSLSSQNNLISYEPTQREQLKKGNFFYKSILVNSARLAKCISAR